MVMRVELGCSYLGAHMWLLGSVCACCTQWVVVHSLHCTCDTSAASPGVQCALELPEDQHKHNALQRTYNCQQAMAIRQGDGMSLSLT